jgi:hypothetical protein
MERDSSLNEILKAVQHRPRKSDLPLLQQRFGSFVKSRTDDELYIACVKHHAADDFPSVEAINRDFEFLKRFKQDC